jgi:hypothetical protein
MKRIRAKCRVNHDRPFRYKTPKPKPRPLKRVRAIYGADDRVTYLMARITEARRVQAWAFRKLAEYLAETAPADPE